MDIKNWNLKNIVNRTKPINVSLPKVPPFNFINYEVFTDESEIYEQYDLFDEFMKSMLEDYTIIAIAKGYTVINGHYSDYYLKWYLIVKSDIATYYMIFKDQNSNQIMSIDNHVCHSHCGPFGVCEERMERVQHQHNFKMISFSFHQLKTISTIDSCDRTIILRLLTLLARQSLVDKCISPF